MIRFFKKLAAALFAPQGDGESGPGARPMRPEWARSLRDQCKHAGVPFLFKQWGEHDERGNKVGKAAAGKLLDGVEHLEFPAVGGGAP